MAEEEFSVTIVEMCTSASLVAVPSAPFDYTVNNQPSGGPRPFTAEAFDTDDQWCDISYHLVDHLGNDPPCAWQTG